jgi:predicted nucleic acid-binding protein
VRAAVIDSSALIYLDYLGLAPKLSNFFDLIYVSSIVEAEVNRKHRFRYRMKKLYLSGKFEKCKTSNTQNRQLLEVTIHSGEADAITQAQERSARFFIGDDLRARTVAERMSIQPVGVARLLFRLSVEGDADDPHRLIQKLRRDLGFRISNIVIQDAVAKASEPIG